MVDIERWLKGKAERTAALGAAGTNVTDYVAADGSNNIAVTADIHDMDAAQACVQGVRKRRSPSSHSRRESPALARGFLVVRNIEAA